MVTLRSFQLSDVPWLVRYLNHDEVTHHITDAIPSPYTEADAHWWLDHSHSTTLIKAIDYEGQLVGCISAEVGDFEYNRSAELGYWVGREHWNKGIATAAVHQFMKQLFEQTDLVRLFVSVVSVNKASIRVLSKNGFSLDGELKMASFRQGKFYDEQLWSLLKPEPLN